MAERLRTANGVTSRPTAAAHPAEKTRPSPVSQKTKQANPAPRPKVVDASQKPRIADGAQKPRIMDGAQKPKVVSPAQKVKVAHVAQEAQEVEAAKPELSYVVHVVPPADIEREAGAMENLLQSFSMKEPFSLELCGEAHQQRFLVRASSEKVLRTLCQQILAQYPQSKLRRLSQKNDPLQLRTGEHAVIGDFTLRAPTWLPIKTFWNEEMTQTGTDPIIGLLSAMEPAGKTERIVSQVTLIRAPDRWVESYKRKAIETPLQRESQDRQEAQGSGRESVDESTWREIRPYLLIVVALAVGFQGYNWYKQHAWMPLVLIGLATMLGVGLFVWWKLRKDNTVYDSKLVAEKLLRSAFYVQVRVVAIGKESRSEEKLRTHLERLEVAYRQYNLANSNGFDLKHIRHMGADDKDAQYLIYPEHSLPYRKPLEQLLHKGGWSDVILNAREVSGMWHLPQKEDEAPMVERLATKGILANAELFQRVMRDPSKFPPVLIGHSEHRGHKVPIYLPEETLFSHKFLVAKSGYGKSTLMQLMVRGAMMPVAGRKQPGVVAIDPHGDLIEDLLRQTPPERAKDVILIDLSDGDHPPGINLLDATLGFTCDQAVANMMASFARIWADSWGPRLAYVLKHVLRSLYTVNEYLVTQDKPTEQYTLLEVLPMLQQPKYAKKILSALDTNNLQHQKEVSWWNDYFFKLPPAFQQEVISPVSNKIGIFNDNHLLGRIVGQPLTTINVNDCVTEGKIILVNLASGRLEFDASAIIGATILNLVHRMLQLQAFIPYTDRRQVFIAVDEFQNIPGADYEAFLSEDRKYGASIMLATQSLIRLEQMKEGLEQMTFSNCAQLFAFATSAEDAEKLEKELHEQVTVPYLLNQPRLTCYARLALPGQPVQIFSMKLATPEGWKRNPQNEAQSALIRTTNRERYRSKQEIDQMLEIQIKRAMGLPTQPEGKSDEKKPAAPPANPPKQQNKPAQDNKAGTPPANKQPGQENKQQGQPGAQPSNKQQGQENKQQGQAGVPPTNKQPGQENKQQGQAGAQPLNKQQGQENKQQGQPGAQPPNKQQGQENKQHGQAGVSPTNKQQGQENKQQGQPGAQPANKQQGQENKQHGQMGAPSANKQQDQENKQQKQAVVPPVPEHKQGDKHNQDGKEQQEANVPRGLHSPPAQENKAVQPAQEAPPVSVPLDAGKQADKKEPVKQQSSNAEQNTKAEAKQPVGYAAVPALPDPMSNKPALEERVVEAPLAEAKKLPEVAQSVSDDSVNVAQPASQDNAELVEEIATSNPGVNIEAEIVSEVLEIDPPEQIEEVVVAEPVVTLLPDGPFASVPAMPGMLAEPAVVPIVSQGPTELDQVQPDAIGPDRPSTEIDHSGEQAEPLQGISEPEDDQDEDEDEDESEPSTVGAATDQPVQKKKKRRSHPRSKRRKQKSEQSPDAPAPNEASPVA